LASVPVLPVEFEPKQSNFPLQLPPPTCRAFDSILETEQRQRVVFQYRENFCIYANEISVKNTCRVTSMLFQVADPSCFNGKKEMIAP